jgi:trk system potassium uptake protein TrkA
MDLQLRQKYNINLVAIKRENVRVKEEGDSIINVPMPDTVIYAGDILMVAGTDKDLARLPQE